MKKTITVSEWRRLSFTLADEPELVPDGWQTTEQIAKEIGKSIPTAGKMLRNGIGAGLVEMKRFRIASGSRGMYPVPHYRMLK